MGKVYLSNQQRELISDAVKTKKSCVLYQTPNFDSSRRIYNTETHAAAVGDVAHLLLHGLTFGGMIYQAERGMNWSSLAADVYNKAVQNGLKVFRSTSQVIIAGSRYVTVYQEGERQKRQMYFQNVVQVSFHKGILELTGEMPNGKNYARINIYNLGEQMENCADIIILYAMRASPFIEKTQKKKLAASREKVEHKTVKPAEKPCSFVEHHYILKGLTGQNAGKRWIINRALVLGRDAQQCDIFFNSHTPGLSRMHCRIEMKGNKPVIRDLNSTYGTRVSGRTSPLMNGEEAVLAEGTVIILGSDEKFFVMYE